MKKSTMTSRVKKFLKSHPNATYGETMKLLKGVDISQSWFRTIRRMVLEQKQRDKENRKKTNCRKMSLKDWASALQVEENDFQEIAQQEAEAMPGGLDTVNEKLDALRTISKLEEEMAYMKWYATGVENDWFEMYLERKIVGDHVGKRRIEKVLQAARKVVEMIPLPEHTESESAKSLLELMVALEGAGVLPSTD